MGIHSRHVCRLQHAKTLKHDHLLHGRSVGVCSIISTALRICYEDLLFLILSTECGGGNFVRNFQSLLIHTYKVVVWLSRLLCHTNIFASCNIYLYVQNVIAKPLKTADLQFARLGYGKRLVDFGHAG